MVLVLVLRDRGRGLGNLADLEVVVGLFVVDDARDVGLGDVVLFGGAFLRGEGFPRSKGSVGANGPDFDWAVSASFGRRVFFLLVGQDSRPLFVEGVANGGRVWVCGR